MLCARQHSHSEPAHLRRRGAHMRRSLLHMRRSNTVTERLSSAWMGCWDPAQRGESTGFTGRLAFVNPPFSELTRWLERAHGEWRAGRVKTVVCLVPVRTDSALFHDRLLVAAIHHGLDHVDDHSHLLLQLEHAAYRCGARPSSRRPNSFSTASRTKSVRSSFGLRATAMRANVPSSNRACICSVQRLRLPMPAANRPAATPPHEDHFTFFAM